MLKDEGLKACPFCGEPAEILDYSENRYLPKCVICNGMIENWFDTKQEAIAAWSRRCEDKEATE